MDAADVPGGTGSAPLDADVGAIPLDGLSPAQVGEFIRGLDGRLLGIDHEHVLVYRFDVAGRERSFRLSARDSVIDSITHLFTEAATHERELQHRYGIQFARPAPR